MAAGQAAELYKDAQIHVIESKSVVTGYAALSCLDITNKNVDDNIAAMNDALARVTAGFVSPAIRDTQMNGVTVHVGDTIGIIGKEIVVSDKDRITATCALASAMLALPDKFMLTVFCGMDTEATEREALETELRKQHPDAEIYLIDGGQEIFPYLLATE